MTDCPLCGELATAHLVGLLIEHLEADGETIDWVAVRRDIAQSDRVDATPTLQETKAHGRSVATRLAWQLERDTEGSR